MPYFQKAYDLEGNSNPWVNEWIAYMYLYLSDYPKSIRHLNISLSLKSEYNLIVRYNGILMAQGKYTEAIHFLDSIRIITPYEQLCDVLKFHVLTAQKDFKNAEKLYNKAASAGYKRDRDDIYIGYLYKETGREKEAITILRNSIRRNDSLLKTVKNNMTLIEINVELAAAHAILGEKFKAINYLSGLKGPGYFEMRFNYYLSPFFDKLREDPELKEVLKRIEDTKTAIRSQVDEMRQRGEINL